MALSLSLESFLLKLKDLKSEAKKFKIETNAIISELQGKKISIVETQNAHNKIFEIFKKTTDELSKIKEEIQQKTNYSNQEDMYNLVVKFTKRETTLLEQLNTFNDAVLTYCPTAEIFYGNSCVGDKIAPRVDTSNREILEILASASCIREIRGDGNCFLAAFTTRFLENLVEKERIISFTEVIYQQDEVQTLGLKEKLIDILLSLKENPSQLENVLKDNHKILPFIHFFRQLAGIEMKKNKELFEPIFEIEIEKIYCEKINNQSYENLIDKYVLKMGIDCSHPMIAALCQKLNFSVRIVGPKIHTNILNTPSVEATFCHHGNHYFVIYTHEEVPQPLVSIQSPSSTQLSSQEPVVKPTEIIIKSEIPDGQYLSIRGNGNGLNWEKGQHLIQINKKTWAYLSSTGLDDMQFKILLNDHVWQNGVNNEICKGKVGEIDAQFTSSSSIAANILDTPQPAHITRITVNFIKASPKDKLFIRGDGPEMSWKKGIELIERNNRWVFETKATFENFEYKILLNDRWEGGYNRKMHCGKEEEIVPKFN